ncbi:MAG: LVIVD repeat-containing protein [Gemmatimonas sp.]
MGTTRVLGALAVAGALSAASTLHSQTYPTGNDPRNGLKAGKGGDAGVAAHGMKLMSLTPKAAVFDSTDGLTFANSDIAFGGKYVYQGNFAGFSIWDVSNPEKPELMSTVKCATSQGDPSIYGNLLFVSAEGAANRKDCGKDPVTDPSQHMAGVRIFDVSNPRAPKLVKNVETCKGSHTHSLLPSKTDKNVLYIYVSGSQGARSEADLPGCKAGTDPADVENSLFRLDVIKVPMNKPEDAKVVTGARIFTGLGPVQRPGRGGGAGRGAAAPAGGAAPAAAPAPTGPRNCHDVTIYPQRDLLAGACGSYGILVDVKNPEKPVRLDAISDTTFSLWHTAVFSNDGKKVVFTDEWGGGTGPMCQATSMMQQGGNTTLEITADRKFKQGGYFKPNFAQTAQENCVSHNGGLIPVPGRDIMTQGWYQGGINVIDFTDPNKPVEIGYYDRGPLDNPPPIDQGPPSNAAGGRGAAARSTTGGSWGSYYWNGYIYSSEIARGLDIVELTPTADLSANEIAAAKLVKFEQYNPQSQPVVSWPAAYPVVRSYVDQLQRKNGLAAARITAINASLDASEKLTGAARKAALTKLGGEVDKDVAGAQDSAKVRTLAAEIKRLAAATK